MRWDVIVVGAGPAGLSAAINVAARNKKVLVVGAVMGSNKVLKAKEMDNYLGLPKIAGPDMAQAFLDHARSFDIQFEQDHVDQIYYMDDYFALQVRKTEDFLEATSVILATGVGVSKYLKNEEKFLGNGVGYCATCDAALFKGKSVVVIGMNDESIEDTNFISEFAAQTTFVNRTGNKAPALNEGIAVLDGQPLGFEGETRAEKLILRNGEVEADGFFIIRDARNAEQLVPGLETDGAHVPVDRNMQTNLPGMYAVGDITGTPYQVAKAVGEGLVAGLDAAKFVTAAKRAAQ